MCHVPHVHTSHQQHALPAAQIAAASVRLGVASIADVYLPAKASTFIEAECAAAVAGQHGGAGQNAAFRQPAACGGLI